MFSLNKLYSLLVYGASVNEHTLFGKRCRIMQPSPEQLVIVKQLVAYGVPDAALRSFQASAVLAACKASRLYKGILELDRVNTYAKPFVPKPTGMSPETPGLSVQALRDPLYPEVSGMVTRTAGASEDTVEYLFGSTIGSVTVSKNAQCSIELMDSFQLLVASSFTGPASVTLQTTPRRQNWNITELFDTVVSQDPDLRGIVDRERPEDVVCAACILLLRMGR